MRVYFVGAILGKLNRLVSPSPGTLSVAAAPLKFLYFWFHHEGKDEKNQTDSYKYHRNYFSWGWTAN